MQQESDIPGYFYDPLNKRYYKIEKHELPGFITKASVTARVVDKETRLTRSRMVFKCKRSSDSLTGRLISREVNHSRSKTSILSMSHQFISNFKLQFSQNLQYLTPVLLSIDGGNCLHAVSHDRLKKFELSQCRLKSGKSNRMRFKFKKIYSKPISDLQCLRILDMCWQVPDKQLVVLGESASLIQIISLGCSGNSYNICSLHSIPVNRHLVKFAAKITENPDHQDFVTMQSATKTQTSNVNSQLYDGISSAHAPVILMTARKLYVSDCNESSPLNTPLFGKPVDVHSKHRIHTHFSACCEATPWRSFDRGLHIVTSVCGKAPLLYVAGETEYNNFLRLIQPAVGSDRAFSLLDFKAGHWSCYRSSDSYNEVTSLQCLWSPSGDRMGLLVGRRCGLLQLWDDRWPNSPAVEYFGSDGEGLKNVASHIPPMPIVDWQTNVVASPLIARPLIGLWDLYTGAVLNLCELPWPSTRQPSDPPPLCFYRSHWANPDGRVYKGPALLSLDSNGVNWFCM